MKGRWTAVLAGIAALMFIVLFISLLLFSIQKGSIFVYTQSAASNERKTAMERQFPIGVDPARKEVIEDPKVEMYFETYILAGSSDARMKTSLLRQAVHKLALLNWYQNLASASSRLLVILPGERKEEVSQHFAKILKWDDAEQDAFLRKIEETSPRIEEGKLYPGRYSVARESDPDVVAHMVLGRFRTEVLSRYGTTTDAVVPIEDALTIASLLEREAYDFDDMRQISGVIWNRLFIGMNLQIDATLQYAKGNKPNEPWWPRVRPEDKFIESPYNTYEHPGLPPAPISNPSLEAILAALNPKKTDCLYYFHDRDAGFHCSVSYKEHVELLKQYYGRGS